MSAIGIYVKIEVSETVCQIANLFANSFHACQKPQTMRQKQWPMRRKPVTDLVPVTELKSASQAGQAALAGKREKEMQKL